MSEIVSVAPTDISGVMFISGLWGVGKTTLAMMYENPLLTVMLDLDQKSRARAKALGMAYYSPADIGLTDPLEYDLSKIVQWFRDTINDLPEGKTTLIIDNGSPLEDAFGEVVRKDPQRYGVRPGNVASNSFGGVNPGIGKLWESVVAFLGKKGYTRIIIIMHMSQSWTNAGPVPNRYKAKGNKTLNQLSNLSLILVRNARPGKPPAAIVAKEALGIIRFENGKFRPVVQPLPPRIPYCSWDHIVDYINTAGERLGYTEEEIPTSFEMSCYGQYMTPEQIAFIKAVAENPNFTMTDEEPAEEEEAAAKTPPPSRSLPSPPSPPPPPLPEKEFTFAQCALWIAEQGWDVDECKVLLLDKFGRPWRPEWEEQYKEHLRSFKKAA